MATSVKQMMEAANAAVPRITPAQALKASAQAKSNNRGQKCLPVPLTAAFPPRTCRPADDDPCRPPRNRMNAIMHDCAPRRHHDNWIYVRC